ncbi:hypothetical protein JXB28_05500 [Candidatus Woesearchaeota archaeon]|nr:hypothetical protein [Candidatus Woesearchaeota archaeon]
MGRPGYEMEIDSLIEYEVQKIEEMKRTLEGITNEINEMKHIKRNLEGLDDFFKWTIQTKRWFEEHYDAKMLRAEEHADEKKSWKQVKYKKMARMSAKMYKKLRRAVATFDELEQHKKRFEFLNQKLKLMIMNVLPQLRKEYYEERVESKG